MSFVKNANVGVLFSWDTPSWILFLERPFIISVNVSNGRWQVNRGHRHDWESPTRVDGVSARSTIAPTGKIHWGFVSEGQVEGSQRSPHLTYRESVRIRWDGSLEQGTIAVPAGSCIVRRSSLWQYDSSEEIQLIGFRVNEELL
jgi:hypothetical protein